MRRTLALKLSYYIPVKRPEVTPFSIAEEMRLPKKPTRENLEVLRDILVLEALMRFRENQILYGDVPP